MRSCVNIIALAYCRKSNAVAAGWNYFFILEVPMGFVACINMSDKETRLLTEQCLELLDMKIAINSFKHEAIPGIL